MTVALDEVVIDVADLVPLHRWRRDEARFGWTCYAPTGPGRPADVCQGCGEFVGDVDVYLLEQRIAESVGRGDLYLTLALAFRRARARAGLPT